MMTLPPSTNVPWTPESIKASMIEAKGARPEYLIDYMTQLVLYMDKTYSDISNAVNSIAKEVKALREEFDSHSHP